MCENVVMLLIAFNDLILDLTSFSVPFALHDIRIN